MGSAEHQALGGVGVDDRLSAGDRGDAQRLHQSQQRECYRDTLAGEETWWRMKSISHFISQSRAN